MSDLINHESLSEEDFDTDMDGEIRSPWAMFITMLLLIAGFFFSSILMVRQTLQARTSEGEPLFNFKTLAEKSTSMIPSPAQQKTVTEVEADTETKPELKQVPAPAANPLEGIKQFVTETTSSDKVRWPKLHLTGFGKSTDGAESFAFINGDLVHPGEFAGKVKLIEVRNHDVVVEYQGERRSLAVEITK